MALSWWVQEDPGQAQPGSEEAEKNCCVKTGQGLKDYYIVIPYHVLYMALVLDTFVWQHRLRMGEDFLWE